MAEAADGARRREQPKEPSQRVGAAAAAAAVEAPPASLPLRDDAGLDDGLDDTGLDEVGKDPHWKIREDMHERHVKCIGNHSLKLSLKSPTVFIKKFITHGGMNHE